MMLGLELDGQPIELEVNAADLGIEDTVWAMRGIVYGRLKAAGYELEIDDLELDLDELALALERDILGDIRTAVGGA